MNDWQWWLMMTLLTGLALCIALWPLRQQRWIVVGVPLLCTMVGLAYWQWGAWSAVVGYERQQARHQQAQALLKTMQGPEALLQRLQAHLVTHPRSARGWYLLGRLAASQHRFAEALHAFAKAYAIKPDDESIAINYAQSLFARHEGRDEAVARQVLVRVLDQNAKQQDALAMLAMDAQQHHQFEQALVYWNRLLVLVPQASEEAAAIRKAMVMIRMDH